MSLNLKSHLKPLNLNELNAFKLNSLKKHQELTGQSIDCILCEIKFNLNTELEEKTYLAHLIATHRVVIADVNLIGDLKKYLSYWKERLKVIKLEDVCFTISTNTGQNDTRVLSENYFLLCDNLPGLV